MRKCASCGRELGAAFATSPVCPCCDGLIAGGTRSRSASAPPPEVFPPLADTFARIITRAAEAALAAPQAPAAAGASDVLPPDPAASNSGTLMMSSKDFESLSGSLGGVPAVAASPSADDDASQNPEAMLNPEAAAGAVAASASKSEPVVPSAEAKAGPTTNERLGATNAKQETPTHLLHTQTFSTPLIPPDGSNIPDLSGAAGTAGINPADLERMSQLWSGTIAGSAHERMTMQAATEVDEIPSLMVGRRVLQQISGGRASDADYQLLDMIGEGGIGVVYAARQASIDRTVAVKMLKSEKTTDQHQRAKFLSEAVITGELDHPNIVPIYDLGASQQGSYFYSMKRVVGTPWNKVVHVKPLVENIEILMKVADAVAFAHSRSVVHRDLKPENVMLGSFGEVLLMDWGLALLTAESRKISVAAYDPGMGGTPAYMSPEMATGPIANIDPRSDVYLLGAILFEIVVGRPPHTGPNVMGCLFAAARNEIVPTDNDGELIKIARRSMASSREDRYATVKDFQNAIREYQSHAESIVLAVQAQDDLTRALSTSDYQDFSRALFGFQQALGLWSGSEQAIAGVRATKEAYAESAIKKADYDLALSLLDAGDLRDDDIRIRATAGRNEREQRQQRLTAAKRMAVGLSALVVVVVTGAFFQIISAERAAQRDRESAIQSQGVALQAAKDAETAKQSALADQKTAEAATALANTRLVEVTAAQGKLTEAAETQRKLTTVAENAAKAAVDAKEKESYEAYVARIGLAAAKIEENSFGTAEQLLFSCDPKLRRWEWARLMYLCRQNRESFRADGPVDCVAFSPDGNRAAAASLDNGILIWSLAAADAEKKPLVVPYGVPFVHAVAFSPNGNDIAIGGSDPNAYAQIYDVASKKVKWTLNGHKDGVLGVCFSRDGSKLLTCSLDNTVRLWNVETGEQEGKPFEGHSSFVWSASFAPPAVPNQQETRIVTAGQDGTVRVWDIQTRSPGQPFKEHKAPVYSATFSPDGKHVVSGGEDKRVLIWDPADVRPYDYQKLIDKEPQIPMKLTALVGHDAAVRTVGYSPDGMQIVSAGNDNTIKVWKVNDHSLVKTLRGHAGRIRSCVFSSDGATLLSGSHDRRVILWDLRKYAEEKVLDGKSDAMLAAEFSLDDQRVVTAGRDHTARIWDAADPKELAQFAEGHSFLVSQAAFVPSPPELAAKFPEGRIATVGIDNTARIWDIARGVEVHHQLRRFENTGRVGATMAVSHDGTVMLTSDDNGKAILWDIAECKKLFTLENQGDEIVWTAFSPDDSQLFTGDANGRCKLWSRDQGMLIGAVSSHSDRITGAVFAAGGRLLLTSSADGSVVQWDLPVGQPLVNRTLKHPEAVSSLAVTTDGRTAVTGCGDGKVRIWNVESGTLDQEIVADSPQMVALSHDGRRVVATGSDSRTVRVFDLESVRNKRNMRLNEVAPLLDLTGRDYLVWCAMFSPDDKRLLTVGGDAAKLWDAATAAELQSFGPQGAIASVDLSPDGAYVVTGSWDQSVKIWNSATGFAARRFAAIGTGSINSVRFSRDGLQVLTASEDGKARLWNAETGALQATTFAQEGPIFAAEFSRDGRKIVTCGDDKRACVWDIATGKQVYLLEGHSQAVRAVAVSPDGRWIATGSDDNTAIVWSAETGRQLYVLQGHTAGLSSVAFTADSERILTGSRDNLAKLWDSLKGKEILTLKGHTQEVTGTTFSRDGLIALATAGDGTAILWPAVKGDWSKYVESPPELDAKTSQTAPRP